MAHRGQREQLQGGLRPDQGLTPTSRHSQEMWHTDTGAWGHGSVHPSEDEAQTNRVGQSGRKGGTGVTETSSRAWDGLKQGGGSSQEEGALEG